MNNTLELPVSTESRDLQVESRPFIEANTHQVDINHLAQDCIIPVFSRDNESTISHQEFISSVFNAAKSFYSTSLLKSPQIRVSHMIKGRVPSAIGKPVVDLREEEKTIYYQRCAFLIEIDKKFEVESGNTLTVSLGGVRAYNEQNLYGKKTAENFKLFIGLKNTVCTNLMVWTSGLQNTVSAHSANEIVYKALELIKSYEPDRHADQIGKLFHTRISQGQFAHLIGKLRMYNHLERSQKEELGNFEFTDSQINSVVRDYYRCPNFKASKDGSIDLWSLYNLLTEANKSSYIDRFLARAANADALIEKVEKSQLYGEPDWFINN